MHCKKKRGKRETLENVRCKLCCVLISRSRVNPRRFLVSAQRSCPEDSVDRTQHTLSWLCWKSNASVPFTLRDLRGWRPVPFRWVMTIRSEPPMRSIGRLSPGSEEKIRTFVILFLFIYFFLCSTICTVETLKAPADLKEGQECIKKKGIEGKWFSDTGLEKQRRTVSMPSPSELESGA